MQLWGDTMGGNTRRSRTDSTGLMVSWINIKYTQILFVQEVFSILKDAPWDSYYQFKKCGRAVLILQGSGRRDDFFFSFFGTKCNVDTLNYIRLSYVRGANQNHGPTCSADRSSKGPELPKNVL